MTGIKPLSASISFAVQELQPAFYDLNLTTKDIRDEDSIEMLELIFSIAFMESAFRSVPT